MKYSFLILGLIMSVFFSGSFSKALGLRQVIDPNIVTKALVNETEDEPIEVSIENSKKEVKKEAQKLLTQFCGVQAASSSYVDVRVLQKHLIADGMGIPYNYVTLEIVYFCADSSKMM